jgi:hypothetical protein
MRPLHLFGETNGDFMTISAAGDPQDQPEELPEVSESQPTGSPVGQKTLSTLRSCTDLFPGL